MEKDFQKFKKWLATNYEDGLKDLNPPATNEEISELINTLGFSVHDDLVNLLKIHNGQKGNAGWLFDGQEFLSSKRIIDEWKVWKGLLDGGDFDSYNSRPLAKVMDTATTDYKDQRSGSASI